MIAPPGWDEPGFPAQCRAALEGGDVASLILPQANLSEDAFQAAAAPLVKLAQERDVAAILAGDTRVAGRLGADGIHVESNAEALADAVERFQAKMTVGTGNVKTRDEALDLGEQRPDYMLFGRFGYDTKPEAHPRNLQLGAWWAEVVEIPCIVMAGSDLASVEVVAQTGAEFVALSAAVFSEGSDPRERVAEANALLDRVAPRWGGGAA